jgi:hypothetical protein
VCYTKGDVRNVYRILNGKLKWPKPVMGDVLRREGTVRFHRVAGHTAQRRSRGIALLFHDLGTRWGWVVSVTPRPPLPPEKTRYPLYRWLGGPQGRSGQVRKISSPPGFDPRTVQPVDSRYTD